MLHILRNFFTRESGAVTVDWVVLAAAVIALGATVTGTMITGTTGLSDDIWNYMDSLDLHSGAGTSPTTPIAIP